MRTRPPTAGIRLQKILAAAGVASRRAAEQLILERRVTVNGTIVDTLGSKADPTQDEVRVDGRRVAVQTRLRYLALNKPRGYVTTARDPEGRRTVMDLVRGVRERVYPVGRLDYDSEGLVLLTNDGDLAARLMHPRHAVDRVYEVVVAGIPGDEALAALRTGIVIDGRRTAPAVVHRGPVVGRRSNATTALTMTLREGRNRQVRRMCAAIGHPVRRLVRVRIGTLSLAGLEPGRWRELSTTEAARLQRAAAAEPQAPVSGGSGSRSASSRGSISSGTARSRRMAGASKPRA